MTTINTSVVTDKGLELVESFASTVYIEDLTDKTNYKELNSVNVANHQLVLADDLTLVKGDIIRIDKDQFQGVYIVTKYESSSHTVTVDNTSERFKSLADTNYDTDKPKVYKVTGLENQVVIKDINIPGATQNKVEITTFMDRSPQHVGGNTEYSDIDLNVFYDVTQPIIQRLVTYFNTKKTFAIWFRTKTDNIDRIELYTVNVSKLGDRKLTNSQFQETDITLSVNEGSRLADLGV